MVSSLSPCPTGKSGCHPNECVKLAQFIIAKCPALEFRGLMTIGKMEADKDDLADFKLLAELRQKMATELKIEEPSLELSMGMSRDYEEAIQYGATIVRVGTSIFGER